MQQARRIVGGSPIYRPTVPVGEPIATPQPQKRLRKVKLFSIYLACFLLSLVVVAQYSSLVVLNYRVSDARAELTAVKDQAYRLELQAAELGSISRIEQIARDELEMIDPAIDDMIILSSGRGAAAVEGE